MASGPHIRIGTRASALARWQADWVASRLEAVVGAQIELVLISTHGDRQQTGPIGGLGTQGVFTKEIQRALLDRRIDVAVHSLKDLPTEVVAGLTLAAVPERASASDVLVSRDDVGWELLREGARVGTGSLRRRAQLLHVRADLEMCDVRGNVETRLRKLDEGEYDALVLAEAGLVRLGLAERIAWVFPPSVMVGAVGQGALGMECRTDDEVARSALALLDDEATHACIAAERAMLATLQGGCSAPIAGAGRTAGETIELTGVVLSGDGRERLAAIGRDERGEAVGLGRRVGEELLALGAGGLIASERSNG